nr:MAG TPA: hypothetical protein [Bacteriophage sp.]
MCYNTATDTVSEYLKLPLEVPEKVSDNYCLIKLIVLQHCNRYCFRILKTSFRSS